MLNPLKRHAKILIRLEEIVRHLDDLTERIKRIEIAAKA